LDHPNENRSFCTEALGFEMRRNLFASTRSAVAILHSTYDVYLQLNGIYASLSSLPSGLLWKSLSKDSSSSVRILHVQNWVDEESDISYSLFSSFLYADYEFKEYMSLAMASMMSDG
jgi:hypothetical protein